MKQNSSLTIPTTVSSRTGLWRCGAAAMLYALALSSLPVAAALKNETFDSAASAAAHGWIELGSRDNGQDFGFSATANAGGPAGEAGGTVKRSTLRSEYVDVFGGTTLTLNDPISASGRIMIPGAYGGNLGHIIGHSDSTLAGSNSQANQMGVIVASSGTRFGVHLSLADATRRESVVVLDGISPGAVYDWEYYYDPNGGTNGNGALMVHIISGGVTNTGVYELTFGDRSTGAVFDSFGLTSRALNSSSATGAAFIDDVVYRVPDIYAYLGTPLITVQPQSLTAPPGINVSFVVNAVGGGLSYQWRSNGVDIAGATGTSLWLTNVSVGPPVSYLAVVSNSHGTTNSQEALLIVTEAPVIASQPESLTLPSGSDAVFSVGAFGEALSYQWHVNGVPIPGASDSSFTNSNVQQDLPLVYNVVVSNSHGSAISSNAVLTVTSTNMFDTSVMSSLWTVPPGERFYLTASGNTARSLAFHPLSSSVILASRSGGNAVVSLDAATGMEQFFLDTSSVAGGTLAINAVGVADDGAVYVANLTTSATSSPYIIYRWATNDPYVSPTIAFTGDPGGASLPGMRWGDNFAVRGAGKNTQIMISPGDVGGRATNVVVVLRTADGVDFQSAVAPAIIQITNAPTGFANLGISFGPGANTFFAKAAGHPLVLVEFDLSAGTGFIKESYSLSAVPGFVSTIAVDPAQNLIAGLAVETPDNVRLYGLADVAGQPGLLDQEAFESNNANTTTGGTGAASFGGGMLFVLDSNNGLKAFALNTAYTPPAPFVISGQPEAGQPMVLSWPTEVGRLYQALATDALQNPWTRIGVPIPGTGSFVAFTNQVPGVDRRFFQVTAQ